jgi:hypothetical protein
MNRDDKDTSFFDIEIDVFIDKVDCYRARLHLEDRENRRRGCPLGADDGLLLPNPVR